MLRAIKIRLYPNKEQELKLNKVNNCLVYDLATISSDRFDNGETEFQAYAELVEKIDISNLFAN